LLTSLLREYLRPYRRQVALIFVLTAMQAGATLYLPNLSADIINNGVVKGDIGYIWTTGAIMLGVSLCQVMIVVLSVYWASKVAMSVGRDLRGGVFEGVQRFSSQEMNRFGAASLITRNTNDIQQIQIFLQVALTMLLLAPIVAVGGVIMALREDVPLSSVLAVVVPLMAVVIGLILRAAIPLFQSMQVKIDRINRTLREQIVGVRVIRAFVRTDFERDRFEDANADLTATSLHVNRIFVLAMPALLTIMNLSSVAVIWFGGHLIASGTMPIGNLIAFLSYIIQILFSVMMGVFVFILAPRAAASGSRIQEVLQTPPSITDPERPVAPPTSTGLVEFRGVSFGYPGGERAVLEGLDFAVRPGEVTAIIGGTGSGKTTLVNLIPRLYDVTSGSVLVDGVDVREQERERLWSMIGFAPQRAYLFSGTVADNLRFGKPEATDDELWHALAIAQAEEFVRGMPGGLSAPIDQGGTNVSGGQRQRLAIARTLVRQPTIYLFDDCFSALDAGTDARLRAALRSETVNRTVVIVAQRVSTVMQAESIIVLDEGRVVGIGTHDSLKSSCPEYTEIVESQLGEEAAA
jgi:ATP-binding cassette subfamily B multidrug efflux pump